MKENTKEKIIRENANKIRAEVIGHAIEVEDALTETLGYLYSQIRDSFYVQRLINDILADLTFEKKIKIFKKFVDLDPDSFSHQKTILKDLNEIRETRNQLAHRSISLPWVFSESEIDSENFNTISKEYTDWKEKINFRKAGKSTFTYTIAELENFKNLCKWTRTSIYLALNNMLSPEDKNNNAT